MKLSLVFLTALALTVILPAAGAAKPPAKPDPWAPMKPFVGEWKGDSEGQPGKGESERVYRFALNNRFIEILNRSTYPPQEKNPKGEVHEDRGFLSYDKAAKKVVMRQFHTEGFVNHYVLDSVSEDGRTLTFLTVAIENIPAGFRGREVYTLLGPDEFEEVFSIAEPGKDFEVYSRARFRRKG